MKLPVTVPDRITGDNETLTVHAPDADNDIKVVTEAYGVLTVVYLSPRDAARLGRALGKAARKAGAEL